MVRKSQSRVPLEAVQKAVSAAAECLKQIEEMYHFVATCSCPTERQDSCLNKFCQSEIDALDSACDAAKGISKEVLADLAGVRGRAVSAFGLGATSATHLAFRLSKKTLQAVSRPLPLVRLWSKLIGSTGCGERGRFDEIKFALYDPETGNTYVALKQLAAEIERERLLSGELVEKDPDQLLSPAALADYLGIPKDDRKRRDALRKQLEAWRNANPEGDGWIEVADRKPKEAGFFYRFGAVRHLLARFRPSS